MLLPDLRAQARDSALVDEIAEFERVRIVISQDLAVV
jgi:hypothetical protein